MAILCFPGEVFTQSGIVIEDFQSGYPNGKVFWSGDSGNFEANSSGQLHLIASGAGQSYTYTQFVGFERMHWRTWAKLSFNTSSGNFASFVLLHDTLQPLQVHLQLGGSDDRLRLRVISNNTDTSLIIGVSAMLNQSVNSLWVDVYYDHGIWSVRSSIDALLWNAEGSAFFPLAVLNGSMGYSCTYTASNSTKFYFDNLLFEPLWPDTLTPFIISWYTPSPTIVQLTFNENIDTASVNQLSMKVEGIHPDNMEWSGQGMQLTVNFLDSLAECTYLNLEVAPFADTSGNWALDTSFQIYHCPVRYADILINELMPDPSPPVGLPETEWVELFNRRAFQLNLEGWTLSIGSTVIRLDSLEIEPGSFLLLVKDLEGAYWADSVEAIRVKSLNIPNTSAFLVLRNESGRIIHAVDYNQDIYGSEVKRDGGWSLERIDDGNRAEDGNWAESQSHRGGTPGQKNSRTGIIADVIPPRAVHADALDPWTVQVFFSEGIDTCNTPGVHSFSLGSNGAVPSGLIIIPPDYRKLILSFNESFIEGEIMDLRCHAAMTDLNGNPGSSPWSVKVALPSPPQVGDLIINEVLYDILPGQAEFIEIFSASERAQDLHSIFLCSYDTSLQAHEPLGALTSELHIIMPGGYRYLSSKPEIIVQYYSAESFPVGIRPPLMTTLSNEGACLSLMSADGLIIDSMCYKPGMHHPALVEESGVSLERISASHDGMDAMNWQSAATIGLGASPGKPNTQKWVAMPFAGEFEMHPRIITPDGDGIDDYMTIAWKSFTLNSYLEIEIFDLAGRRVYQFDPGISGESGTLHWNARGQSGNNLPEGIYILNIRVFQGGERQHSIKYSLGIKYR